MGSLTQWRGQPDTTLGRLGWGFAMSVLLHAPLTPLAALFGLLTLLTAAPPPAEPLPPLTGIPVDLIEGEEAETPPPATQPPPAPEPAVAIEPAEKPERSEPKIRDAGVADAEPSDASTDADAASEGNDAGIEDGGITDPVAASGAEKIADVNANVQIKIFSEKIRSHPLARRVGPLIASVPQWSDFLGPAALDPIADVDRILIWGPQLRDSSEVGALVKVNVSKERVHAAIDAIVRSDPDTGAWLDAGVPAATARVDRAPRVFILPPSDLVIVVPPTAAEKTMKAAPKLKFRAASGPEVATARLKTPWRAFRGTRIPIDIPRSISDVRLKMTLDEHGGAIIEAVAKDESPEKAAEDAAYLERSLNALNEQNLLNLFGAALGLGRQKFVEKIVVTSRDNEIRLAVLVTQRQLAMALDFAPMLFGGRRRAPRPDASLPEPTPPGRQPAPEGPSRPAPELGREPVPTPSPSPSL